MARSQAPAFLDRGLLPGGQPGKGVLTSCWKLDREGRSSAWAALYADRASMGLDDPAADVEPQAESAIVIGGDPALQAVEDAGLESRVDPDPGIRDGHSRDPVRGTDRDRDRLALAELHGVRKQVSDDLIEAGAIPDADDGAAGVDRDRATGPRQLRREPVHDIPDQGPQLEWVGLDREPVGLDPRDFEEVADEAVEPRALARCELHRLAHPRRVGAPARLLRALQGSQGYGERGHGGAQLVGGHHEELIPQADGALRLTVQPRVVDGDRGAVRHLVCQLEIDAPVPPRRAGAQGEHAKHLPARYERHDHCAAGTDGPDEFQVLFALAARPQELAGGP